MLDIDGVSHLSCQDITGGQYSPCFGLEAESCDRGDGGICATRSGSGSLLVTAGNRSSCAGTSVFRCRLGNSSGSQWRLLSFSGTCAWRTILTTNANDNLYCLDQNQILPLMHRWRTRIFLVSTLSRSCSRNRSWASFRNTLVLPSW